MDEQTEGANAAGQWIRNNLVTLGSAAVLTVYSAGYFRTQDAAQRFATESVRRRPATAATATSPRTKANSSVARTEASPPAKSTLPVMRLSSAHSDEHAQSGKPAPAPAAEKSVTATTPAAPGSDSSFKLAAPGPTAPLAAQTPPAPLASPVSPQPAPAPLPDSAAPQTVKAREAATLKDGVYYGWGTSRHGDIQASVEIKDGKIVGAYISQCLTQYSCSWVSALPPEVVQRQSAEVDYVSGATQSSNAFYYAVADALKKAK